MAVPPYMGNRLAQHYESEGNDVNLALQQASNEAAAAAQGHTVSRDRQDTITRIATDAIAGGLHGDMLGIAQSLQQALAAQGHPVPCDREDTITRVATNAIAGGLHGDVQSLARQLQQGISATHRDEHAQAESEEEEALAAAPSVPTFTTGWTDATLLPYVDVSTEESPSG